MEGESNKVGRPTKYDASYVELGYKFCLLGATDAKLAELFEVDEKTINNWKTDYPEFLQSIKRGKAQADAQVAASLFHRATGYEHPDTDIKMYEGQIIETALTKHYPPDTTAAIFWLKNRQPAEWRDKQETEHSGNLNLTNNPITFE